MESLCDDYLEEFLSLYHPNVVDTRPIMHFTSKNPEARGRISPLSLCSGSVTASELNSRPVDHNFRLTGVEWSES